VMLNREELKKKFSSMLQEKAEGVVKGTVGKSMPWGMHELDTPDEVLKWLREEDTVAIYKD